MTQSPHFDTSLLSQKLTNLMLDLHPLISRHWGDQSVAELKPDESWVTAVDRHVEAELKLLFNKLLPEAYFLGEETHPQALGAEDQLLKHELVIVVDPIDGTREYVSGRKEFGSIIAICRREAARFIPFYGFTYRPILTDKLDQRSRGTVTYTDSQGVTQIDLSLDVSGDIVRDSKALREISTQIPTKTRIVSPKATLLLIPKHFELLGSSASVVDLLQPSQGSAEAAISKSRFWDIAGPVAIAAALKYPIWCLSSGSKLNGFTINNFVQDQSEYKWQLKDPIVIGARW